MDYKPRLSTVGALIGDTARALMLSALMDGRSRTAGELACEAGVTPQTASSHLARLTDGGLVRVERRGRCRYVCLASPEVAAMLESVMALAEDREGGHSVRQRDPVRIARTCYDHLAGRLGVEILQKLEFRELVQRQGGRIDVTASGGHFFESLGIDLAQVRRQRRNFAHTCGDWSEQQYHLGGALGATLAERLLALGWIRSGSRSRVVHITRPGILGLRRTLGIGVMQS